MEKYNGWTNYSTWRINLEIVDGMKPSDFVGYDCPVVSELKDAIKEYVESAIEDSTTPGIGRDYALAFVSDANFWEIADHLIADYADEDETETETD
jgi:hypothetical protein